MHKLYFFIYFITVIFLSTNSFSLSSSSYLVANSALMLYDYEKASDYYDISYLEDFNKPDLN